MRCAFCPTGGTAANPKQESSPSERSFVADVALFEFQFVEPERETRRREGRRERVGRGKFLRLPVPVRSWIEKDARRELHRVDHPQLADAEGGVERRLAPHVVTSRAIRDLDNEQHVRPLRSFGSRALG